MRRPIFLICFSLATAHLACGSSGEPGAGSDGAGGDGAGTGSGATGAASSGSGSGAGTSAASGSGGAGTSAASGSGGAGTSAATGSGGAGAGGPTGFAQMEDLDRGLVAVPTDGGTYVGFRLFGYDPDDIAFNVYRDGAKVNAAPLTDSTNLVDRGGSPSSVYTVRPVVGGVEQGESESAPVWKDGALSIPTTPPPAGDGYTYSSGDGSVGDVDGDGRYEIILKWDPSNLQDNSKAGRTGKTYLDAYSLDGKRLWRIDLGVNIRAGAHYSPFLVYDLDGDGKAEVAVKTAPGTRDGRGEYLSKGPAAGDDDSKDYRNNDGYILTGPEYLTVFAGDTGAELATTEFKVGRGDVCSWGNNECYGNRVDRFVGTIAFLDDTGRPSVVFGRGYYARTTLSAWNYRDGALSNLWTFDSSSSRANEAFGGKGCHSISVANVDDDPQQEIINGGATFDNDGKGLCAVDYYAHGDALHVTDHVPSRPGLEVFQPYEGSESPAYAMRDARTCEVLWKGPGNGGEEGPGRGVAADVDPRSPGSEAWVNNSELLRGSDGDGVGSRPASSNFLIWWDADLSRELLDGNGIRQADGQGGNFTAAGCTSNNGTKSTPTLSADILGDWREEVIFRCGDSIRIFTTNQVATNRIYTLMHDPQYRVAISWQNGAYNQPPHPSFHIGEGMAAAPKPDIHVR
ncbi:rhamnogalacturonan lyase [Sorangium sp. So ce764]|uniref:rhamnogalacturonan lyase n=1 Tax=Sorangium sp. So ce764 TaxID=3133320 RepID=UPI003F60739C